MNYTYALDQCTGYLLDILGAPPGPLPERAQGHWAGLFRLAAEQHIYHYLAAWMLEYWNEALPDTIRKQLWKDMEWSKARNIKLAQEILDLGGMFNRAGIPAMFLKGAAGLVRGVYPTGWRYISDIDVLVMRKDIDRACQMLTTVGYENNDTDFFKHHHHLAPFCHQNKIAEVEIHLQPYQQDRSDTAPLWSNADRVEFCGEAFCIPSINDHVWISVRTDLLDGVCIPSLKEAMELSMILNAGYSVNSATLYGRAKAFHVPNLMRGLFYSSIRYAGVPEIPGSNATPDELIEAWEQWSVRYKKKMSFHDVNLYGAEKDWAALQFLTGGDVTHTIGFALWLMRYNKKKYGVAALRATGLYPLYSKYKRH